MITSLCGLRGHASDDVRVSGVGDGEGADTEELSASGSELDVVAVVVVDSSLSEHGVVLDLRLSAIISIKLNIQISNKTDIN